MPSDVFDNSVAFSDTISSVILNWSKKDNYAQTRSAEKYSVTDEPGRWVPTPPAYSSAMEPHWNEIHPLVLDSATPVSYTHLRAHETDSYLVCRLLLEKKNNLYRIVNHNTHRQNA